VNDVQLTLLVTLALVVMVIFLFLKNLSANGSSSLALPSRSSAHSRDVPDGVQLDNLSLMALDIVGGISSWMTRS